MVGEGAMRQSYRFPPSSSTSSFYGLETLLPKLGAVSKLWSTRGDGWSMGRRLLLVLCAGVSRSHPRLMRFASLLGNHGVGQIVFVNIAHVLDRFPADLPRSNQFHVVKP